MVDWSTVDKFVSSYHSRTGWTCLGMARSRAEWPRWQAESYQSYLGSGYPMAAVAKVVELAAEGENMMSWVLPQWHHRILGQHEHIAVEG